MSDLTESYYRLRRQSSILRDGASRFEGKDWEHLADMVVRKADGWELRVYRVENVVEACLISPDGESHTYS